MAGSTSMGIPREKIPWYPTINQDLCSGCGACLDFCSNDVFAQVGLTSIVANPYNCVIGCGSCLNECISDALSLPDIKMLAHMLCCLREKQKIKF